MGFAKEPRAQASDIDIMKKKFSLFFCVPLFLFFTVPVFAETNAEQAAVTNAQLGLAYLQKGYYSASKERLLSALRDDPHIAASWYSMAYYLEKTGDAKTADDYYQKAISVDSHSGSAKNNYGTFLCRSGQYQKAIRYFVLAAREPSYLDVASAYENAGICAMRIPDNKMAMRYFQRALDNNPGRYLSLLNIARLNYLAHDPAAAEKYFVDFQKIALHNQPASVVQKYRDYVFERSNL